MHVFIIQLHVHDVQYMGLLRDLVQIVADGMQLLHHGEVVGRRRVLGHHTVYQMTEISYNFV